MATRDSNQWLLLIHQLPPKPDALRVKIWRRLQQVGAVALKPTVYILPPSPQAREDLNWILKEIAQGGGDGSISEARFLGGLSDAQITGLFQNARKLDYERLIQDAKALLAEKLSGKDQPHGPSLRISGLQKRFAEISAMDFFPPPERSVAEALIEKLRHPPAEAFSEKTPREGLEPLAGKTWVTRENVFVDRLACGWLIHRFVDPAAGFRFVPESSPIPESHEIRFDMFEGEFTHQGDRCTFEVMIDRLGLREDPGLVPIAEMVHDLDLKDGKYGRTETGGLHALISGLVVLHSKDEERMAEASKIFESLYLYYQEIEKKKNN